MFDYQAGEKYKLTLIMVGLAGSAGMFFHSFAHAPPQGRRNVTKRAPSYMGRSQHHRTCARHAGLPKSNPKEQAAATAGQQQEQAPQAPATPAVEY